MNSSPGWRDKLGMNALQRIGFYNPLKRQRNSSQGNQCNKNNASQSRSLTSHDQYTVAWICALYTELAAARAVLDEVHADLPRHSNDTNVYTLGSIGRHNIVIACLPDNQYGTNSAASVLTHLLRTFQSIRHGLMVGIGGGVPGKIDIRLGDIVVGTRVIQYDLGKIVEDKKIQRTAIPKTPHQELGKAVSSLRAAHEKGGSQVPTILKERFGKQIGYSRPGSQDCLFLPDYNHVSETPDCDECDRSNLVPRSSRMTNNPLIHYGAIASGNQVMKNGNQRDDISRQLDVICFEMEAAGLMDIFPCLPIRGICDYSDSHKNKEWQRYAAATAAAYAREFLQVLPVAEVQSTPVYIPNPDPSSSDDPLRSSTIMERPAYTPKRGFEQYNQGGANQALPQRHFIVPFGRNMGFVGRESILSQLLEIIRPGANQDDCQRIAVEGLGGVGKTQIVLETVFRVRNEHPDCSIFWVPALDAASFDNAYREIGRQLRLNGIEGSSADVKSLVKTALSESPDNWLLIIDNADDAELLFQHDASSASLAKYLPFNRNGSIVFTTRNHQVTVGLDISVSNVFVIGKMERNESTSMLQQSIKKGEISDIENSSELLDFLSDLPLAIKQASAYMAKTGISTAKYLHYCRSSPKSLIKLLSKDFEDRGRYESIINPVATTWLISFEHISRDNKHAAEYLRFMCFLAEKGIPTSLLPVDDELDDNEMERDEAIGSLKAYAFVSEHSESGLLDMHRLVRLAMRNWLENENKLEAYFTAVLCRLAVFFPSPTHDNRDTWLKYLPHGQTVLGVSEVTGNSKAKSELLFKVGWCLALSGKFQQAEEMHRAALELREQEAGEENPDTLVGMNRLANVLQSQGRLWDAEKMYLQTLALQQRILGNEHPDTLTSMNSLAHLHYVRGAYDKAESLHRRTLEARERVLGNKHSDTFSSMNNLASLLTATGEHQEAEQIYRQMLGLMEELHGKEHPYTLTGTNNLANLLRFQGRYLEAEQMCRQTLELRQKILGHEHPDTLASMQNVALFLINRGAYDEGVHLQRQTLRLQQKVLGSENPDTIAAAKNLRQALQNPPHSSSKITTEASPTNLMTTCTSAEAESGGGGAITVEPLAPASTSSEIPGKSSYCPTPNKPSTPQQFHRQSNIEDPSKTGRRKALLIGINYFGQRGQLRNCIDDVRNVATYLTQDAGYRRDEMVILTDDQKNPLSQPTKQNVLRAMHWLAKDTRPNDSLFFHYSGHGGQIKDVDDNEDSSQEAIYPVDFREVGYVTDNEMQQIMLLPLPAGVRLTAVFDSCHSNGPLSLPFVYSAQGIIRKPKSTETSQGLLGLVSSDKKSGLAGMINRISLKKEATKRDGFDERNINSRGSSADVIIWTSSKVDKKYKHTATASETNSTMSRVLLNSLKSNPLQTYNQLLKTARDEISAEHNQIPTLSCSYSLDQELLVII